MRAVITAEEARQITGGREPLLPVEYEAACQQLAACRAVDEAKYWADKATALAAWAKIYHSTKAAREARLLKLHAYRRMSQIAEELRKTKPGPGGGGPEKLLQEHGFSKWEAQQIRAVGRASDSDFQRALRSDMPPSPASFKNHGGARGPDAQSALYSLNHFIQRVTPAEFAATVHAKDCKNVLRAVTAVTEWLDAVERKLSQVKAA